MPRPAVSVILPAYNAELFIKEAIESVLNQTFQDFEFLIINDGSQDNTLPLIQSFKDPRIRLISNPRNIGLAATLNLGLEKAQGQFIARLDADDLAFPQRLKKQLASFKKDPQVGLVSSRSQIIDERGEGKRVSKWSFSPEAIYYILHFRNCLAHSSVMFEKATALSLGGYPLSSAEDFELWAKFSRQKKIIHLPQALIKRRELTNSLSSDNATKIKKDANHSRRLYLEKITNTSIQPFVIECLFDNSKISKLDPADKQSFSRRLPLILKAVHQNAPQYCRKRVLKDYLEIEMFKFQQLLKNDSTLKTELFARPISPINRIKGAAFYFSRYAKLRGVTPILKAVLPQSHF